MLQDSNSTLVVVDSCVYYAERTFIRLTHTCLAIFVSQRSYAYLVITGYSYSSPPILNLDTRNHGVMNILQK